MKKYYAVLTRDIVKVERNSETGEILSITFAKEDVQKMSSSVKLEKLKEYPLHPFKKSE